MNLIKQHILSWKRETFDEDSFNEGRIIIHDSLQVKGNLHRLLPANFSSPIPSAVISAPDSNQVTTFNLAIGSIRIPLVHNMSLRPTMSAVTKDPSQTEGDGVVPETSPQPTELEQLILTMSTRDGKFVSLKMTSSEMLQKWHYALREGIAELLFTKCFQYHPTEHTLSVKRLETGIKRGAAFVQNAHCHMLRAKRLRGLKLDLHEIQTRLGQDALSLSREDVQAFLKRAEVDRLIIEDAEYQKLKSIEPSLTPAADLPSRVVPDAPAEDMLNSSKVEISLSEVEDASESRHSRPMFCSPTFPCRKGSALSSSQSSSLHQGAVHDCYCDVAALTKSPTKSTSSQKKVRRRKKSRKSHSNSASPSSDCESSAPSSPNKKVHSSFSGGKGDKMCLLRSETDSFYTMYSAENHSRYCLHFTSLFCSFSLGLFA